MYVVPWNPESYTYIKLIEHRPRVENKVQEHWWRDLSRKEKLTQTDTSKETDTHHCSSEKHSEINGKCLGWRCHKDCPWRSIMPFKLCKGTGSQLREKSSVNGVTVSWIVLWNSCLRFKETRISNCANKVYFSKKVHKNKQKIHTNWKKNFKIIQKAQAHWKVIKITCKNAN